MTLQIMLPFYGSFDHFRVAVRSVLNQSDPDWHLTIVDDVYPDLAPGQWAQDLGDPRITYIRNEVNLRPSRNYNKCVGMVDSEFVVLMGCDDEMLPNYVARVKQLIVLFPDVDVIQPGVSVMDENGADSRPLADRVKPLYRIGGKGARIASGEDLALSLVRGNWTYFPSLVWRVEKLRSGFRTDLDVVQDLAMLWEIVKSGGSLAVDDQVVFRYRRHSKSVSAVTGPDGSKFRQERKLFGEIVRDARALGWNRAARAASQHISSRLNALTELPQAIKTKNTLGRRTLLRHILRRPY